MKYFHACIFAKYADLSGIVNVWETKCNSLLVVEHPAEGKTARIHCHFLMETATGENWFRDQAKDIMGEYIKRGNYWIATRVQKGEFAGQEISRQHTAVYMLKGKLPVKYSKNFSNEEVESSRQSWVDSVKNDKTEDSASVYYINMVVKNYSAYKSYHEYCHFVEDKFNDENHHVSPPPSPIGMLLDNVRKDAFRMMYMKNRMAPHAMMYKQVAASAFLRIMEDWGKLEDGIHRLQNLWY